MSSHVARHALASFVALHGIAHLAGTTDLLTHAADDRAAALLVGVTSDPFKLRTLAVASAAVAVAYLVAAAYTWTGRQRWLQMLGWTTLASLGLCVILLWASVIGLVIDLVLLAVVAVVLIRGWGQAATRAGISVQSHANASTASQSV